MASPSSPPRLPPVNLIHTPSLINILTVKPQRGPLLLSPHELSLHNGTAPLLPIYLAINSTIFDVSASPHTYGPGGSYHVFAGRDATRAFVTGCFQTDLTGDLRGVERMYLPVEDVDEGGETGKGLSSGERKIRTEQEKREARKKSRKEVEKWVRFYGDSEKYFEVGRLVGPEGEGEGAYTGEAPNLCDSAENARPKRSQLNAQAAENAGGRAGKKPLFQPQKGERGQGKPF